MTDELDWYLSRSGPRATVTARPDLGAVARAVALWAYETERPRDATRMIAEMTRRSVAHAVDAALWNNPLLLSPKKRERQPPLPPAADARLVALARKRVRELYPELERAERAGELSFFEREHPGVRMILNGCYEGSGGGRPRVPENYPLMLTEVARGLLDLARAAEESGRAELKHLGEEALDCYGLCREVSATCEMLRHRGQELCPELRASAEGDQPDRMASYHAERITSPVSARRTREKAGSSRRRGA
jgi:hypothetical protein